MRVPHTELQPDTLTALIESFVMREGTDYGTVERSLESKIADVRRQLEEGSAFVTYDEPSDSVSIVAKNAPPPAGPTERPTDFGAPSYGGRSQEPRGDFEDYSQDYPDGD